MLKSEWFELPLERQLTLHKINSEIDECRDIDLLRENLKSLSQQNARFQHMIGEMLKHSLSAEVTKLFAEQAKQEK
jgi:5,10-methylene-tetrahydrofolate dehydrogenase/methenyl tetrahydrofolate cyclohydrolase